MIGHIRSIKMSGLAEKLSSTISELRVSEITASGPFRAFGAITSAVAQIPLLVSPPVAFAMYLGVAASTGKPLDATRLFSALSFIILLAQPLFWMFEVVLDLGAAFGAFDRIQKFLVEETRKDYREGARKPTSSREYTMEADNVELHTLRLSAARHGVASSDARLSLEVNNGSFGWTPDKTVLNGVNLELNKGQFAMIIGPVASGKTTFLKGLLGEVPYSNGKVWVGSDRLSWCDQSPWILVSSPYPNACALFHVSSKLTFKEPNHSTKHHRLLSLQ